MTLINLIVLVIGLGAAVLVGMIAASIFWSSSD
jgi:hypothetical protein